MTTNSIIETQIVDPEFRRSELLTGNLNLTTSVILRDSQIFPDSSDPFVPTALQLQSTTPAKEESSDE